MSTATFDSPLGGRGASSCRLALALGAIAIALFALAPHSASGASPASLEIPGDGSNVSGIGLASGWICRARKVEIQLDDHEPMVAAYGTPRGDTREICGDTDNGFGLLINWNLLGDGSHTAVARADGVEFARVEFKVQTLGTSFLRGAKGTHDVTIGGFHVTLEWSEAQQNFVIVGALPPPEVVEEVEMDIAAYCRSKGRAGALLRTQWAYGWWCTDANGQLAEPLNYTSFLELCETQVGSHPYPVFTDVDDAFSWRCKLEDVEPAKVDLAAYCAGFGLEAKLTSPTDPFGWSCGDPSLGLPIDFNSVCPAQHPKRRPFPMLLDDRDAFSWRCGQRYFAF